MDTALLIGRLLLIIVFAVAGVAKLADRKGSRQAIIDFGLPRSFVTPLSILVPLCELAVAAALIPAQSAWWGALGALALLLAFIAGISLTWPEDASQSATASGSCTPLLQVGRLSCATVLWSPWHSSSC